VTTGVSNDLRYLLSAFGGLGRFASIHAAAAASTVPLTWTRSVSITSALGRVLDASALPQSRAFLIATALVLVCAVIARQFYSANFAHGFPLRRPGDAPAADDSDEAVVALEWCGLMVLWLAFGPEVSRRHMYVLILLHAAAVTLLAGASGWRRAWIIAAIVLGQFALRLPSRGPLASIQILFDWIGGPALCLLAYYGTLFCAGLGWRRTKFPASAAELPPEEWDAELIRGVPLSD
jgi:hypothetical protein